MTQYSLDQKNWIEVPGKFDANKIAHMLRAVRGDWIYYREREGDLVRRMKYVGK